MSSGLRDLWVLIRLRWRLLLRIALSRYTRSAREAAPIRLIVGVVLVLWFVASLVIPVTFAMSQAYTGPDGLARFTSTAVTTSSAVTLLVFFYAVLSLVNALTGGGDLRLLLLTPISPRLIAGFRILAVALGFSPVLLFGVPGLLAAGHALHFGVEYTVAVFLLILIVPIAPVALATLLVLAVLRWLPPARARTVTTALGVVLGAGLFIASQLFFYGRAYSGGGTVPTLSLPAWLPSTWPGRGLVALGAGQADRATLYLGATVLLAAALCGVAVELAGRLLETGGATYAEVGRRRTRVGIVRLRAGTGEPAARPIVAVSAPRLFRRIRWLPLLHKDWLTFRRDPQRLATLVYPLLLVGFYLYRLLGQRALFSTVESTTFLASALYAILVFSIVILIGPTAATIVNREGRSLYLLALAPLPVRDLLVAKWTFVAVPVVAVIEIILGIGAHILGIDPGQALLAGLVLAALSIALSGVALTINLIWPRFESENPRRQGSGIANIVGIITDFGIGGISCALLIAAIEIWPSYPAVAAALALGVFLVTGGSGVLALIFGTRVLANLLTSDRRPR